MEQGFTVTRLRDRVLQISNGVGNCCTLLLGQERALLFDTMCGLGDLLGCIRTLTELPLTVVLSHGHYDHIGGLWQFGEAYLHPADFHIPGHTLPILEEIQEALGAELSGCRRSLTQREKLRELFPGTVFSLGGMTAVAVALPGHTRGSMGLVIPELRLLLAGDAVSPTMCLFYPDSAGLAVYRDTLQRVMAMDIDWFVQGHYTILFPRAMLDRFLACTGLPGRKKGYPYQNSQVSAYRGRVYILELRNPDIDSMICLITGEQEDGIPDTTKKEG